MRKPPPSPSPGGAEPWARGPAMWPLSSQTSACFCTSPLTGNKYEGVRWPPRFLRRERGVHEASCWVLWAEQRQPIFLPWLYQLPRGRNSGPATEELRPFALSGPQFPASEPRLDERPPGPEIWAQRACAVGRVCRAGLASTAQVCWICQLTLSLWGSTQESLHFPAPRDVFSFFPSFCITEGSAWPRRAGTTQWWDG